MTMASPPVKVSVETESNKRITLWDRRPRSRSGRPSISEHTHSHHTSVEHHESPTVASHNNNHHHNSPHYNQNNNREVEGVSASHTVAVGSEQKPGELKQYCIPNEANQGIDAKIKKREKSVKHKLKKKLGLAHMKEDSDSSLADHDLSISHDSELDDWSE